ncbi:hypothetical protein R69888_06718 [Paraburkholderia haematera]|uniref:Transposase n=1 Tax=Paraburkholderia haematera TaxID=2793077 RepID=A0ABM8SV58_9BURK|nr:hypothetical protein R69888_06718 [Paraburkholderia haematera]
MTLQTVSPDFVARFALEQLHGRLPVLQLRIHLARVKLCSSASASDVHGKNCCSLQGPRGHLGREPV